MEMNIFCEPCMPKQTIRQIYTNNSCCSQSKDQPQNSQEDIMKPYSPWTLYNLHSTPHSMSPSMLLCLQFVLVHLIHRMQLTVLHLNRQQQFCCKIPLKSLFEGLLDTQKRDLIVQSKTQSNKAGLKASIFFLAQTC